MDELTFQRAEDGRLVCADEAGVEYAVTVDDALRTAVRTLVPRDSETEIVRIPQELRPRDIQALIRRGTPPEEIVEASGLTLDYVNRYAAPVMDEREYVALRARALPINWDRDAPSLEETVTRRLTELGTEGAGQAWDAVRQAHGWVVRVDFEADDGPSHARWRVDLVDRQLYPLDEIARWIGTDQPADSPIPPSRMLIAVPPDPNQGDDNQDGLDQQDDRLSLLDGLMENRGLREPVGLGSQLDTIGLAADVLELRPGEDPPTAQLGDGDLDASSGLGSATDRGFGFGSDSSQDADSGSGLGRLGYWETPSLLNDTEPTELPPPLG